MDSGVQVNKDYVSKEDLVKERDVVMALADLGLACERSNIRLAEVRFDGAGGGDDGIDIKGPVGIVRAITRTLRELSSKGGR